MKNPSFSLSHSPTHLTRRISHINLTSFLISPSPIIHFLLSSFRSRIWGRRWKETEETASKIRYATKKLEVVGDRFRGQLEREHKRRIIQSETLFEERRSPIVPKEFKKVSEPNEEDLKVKI